MIKIKLLFDDIYNILIQKQTLFEFILNLSFILIIFIIIVVFYWDSINRKIIKTGRCRVTLDNSDSMYNVSIYDKTNNTSILNISYDNTPKHKYDISCTCPTGEYVNKFEDIPIYNASESKFEGITKFCYCDNDKYANNIYDNTIHKFKYNDILMDGDTFLVNYYNTYYDTLNRNPTIDNRNKSVYSEPILFPSS
jgi:hypothetical protein